MERILRINNISMEEQAFLSLCENERKIVFARQKVFDEETNDPEEMLILNDLEKEELIKTYYPQFYHEQRLGFPTEYMAEYKSETKVIKEMKTKYKDKFSDDFIKRKKKAFVLAIKSRYTDSRSKKIKSPRYQFNMTLFNQIYIELLHRGDSMTEGEINVLTRINECIEIETELMLGQRKNHIKNGLPLKWKHITEESESLKANCKVVSKYMNSVTREKKKLLNITQ